MTKLYLNCPFCLEKRYFENKINLSKDRKYLICLSCGGGILSPKPHGLSLIGIYKKKKYFENLSRPVNNKFLQWVLTRRIFETPPEWVLKNFPKKGSILDIGCGNGEFLESLKVAGWDVWGSDISAQAVKRTRNRLGENSRIKLGSFSSQNFNEKFYLISFWHVLEHIYNPANYFSKARNLLEDGGHIVGEMPNFDSWVLRFFGKRYSWFMVPDHLIYFSNKGLRVLLTKTGFRKIRIYSPSRALLNFSFSFNILLESVHIPKLLRIVFFAVSIPMSIIIVFLESSVGSGEVLRFQAAK